MSRDLIQVVHTVTPNETHFVVSGPTYVGILSFWIIALFKGEGDAEPWLDSFPIVAHGGATIWEQIQDDSLTVLHWSEMRNWLNYPTTVKDDVEGIHELLDRLWADA